MPTTKPRFVNRWATSRCAIGTILLGAALTSGCRRTPKEHAAPVLVGTSMTSDAGPLAPGSSHPLSASATAPRPVPSARPIGPYEAEWAPKRVVFFAVPPRERLGQRLIGNLHGMCNPPGYSCGLIAKSATRHGFLVCPTGNATCGPGMYNAPTWSQPPAKVRADLEASIAHVGALYPGEIRREGAILTGFSMGATFAVQLAEQEPGRWPYLLLNEAVLPLSKARLEKAGVRRVALFAGEKSEAFHGQKALAARLMKEGYPARFWSMRAAGHHYSDDIENLTDEALAWLTEGE